MVHRPSVLLLIPLAVIVLSTGCARRPASHQSAAPPPTSVSGATAPEPRAVPAPTTPSPAAVQPLTPLAERPAASDTATATARPPQRDFVAVPDLRDIHFDFDKYEIRTVDTEILDANAKWLRQQGEQLLLIEGHADERGTNEYNLALGERRAKAAMDYLVSRGIAAARVTVISYGEERPLCKEGNEGCWSRNRRAHFLAKPR